MTTSTAKQVYKVEARTNIQSATEDKSTRWSLPNVQYVANAEVGYARASDGKILASVQTSTHEPNTVALVPAKVHPTKTQKSKRIITIDQERRVAQGPKNMDELAGGNFPKLGAASPAKIHDDARAVTINARLLHRLMESLSRPGGDGDVTLYLPPDSGDPIIVESRDEEVPFGFGVIMPLLTNEKRIESARANYATWKSHQDAMDSVALKNI